MNVCRFDAFTFIHSISSFLWMKLVKKIPWGSSPKRMVLNLSTVAISYVLKDTQQSMIKKLFLLCIPWLMATVQAGEVFLMPMNCSELLPDNQPFVQFFDSVALGVLPKDRAFAKRLLRIKSLREKVFETKDKGREDNPVDLLLRETVCFYRKTKDPIKQIPFDDADFVSFLRKSIKTLEAKVDDAIFQLEYERHQREIFEKKSEKNQALLRSLENEALEDANRTFSKISKAAEKKARTEN